MEMQEEVYEAPMDAHEDEVVEQEVIDGHVERTRWGVRPTNYVGTEHYALVPLVRVRRDDSPTWKLIVLVLGITFAVLFACWAALMGMIGAGAGS